MLSVSQTVVRNSWVLRGCALVAGITVIFIAREVVERRRKKRLRKEWDSVGKDVVLLHQFIRGKYCLNLSPYALKVETFLRLAKIEYVVDTDSPYGPKGKCPWITVNGEDLGDSEIIVRKLIKDFKVDLDSHLNPRRTAQLEAVRIMADEYIFWCVITWRYWLDCCATFLKTQSFPPFLTFIFPFFMTRAIRDKAVMHGFGVHTPEEIYVFSQRACHTLSQILGSDKFFGGESPCTADCAVFGQLSQLMWNAPGTRYEALVKELYPSLGDYCNRMKETIFPDWDKLLNPPVED